MPYSSPNGYFYLPVEGAKGTSELTLYNAAQNAVDEVLGKLYNLGEINSPALYLGDGTNGERYIFADINNLPAKPAIRYYATTGTWQISNDGVTWTDIGATPISGDTGTTSSTFEINTLSFGLIISTAGMTVDRTVLGEALYQASINVHTQGTDLGLDTGGTNPITAATIKGHVDVVAGNPHGTNLDQIDDVDITSVQVDDVLKYNGADWVNGTAGSIGAGPATIFYLDNDAQDGAYQTLLIAPDTITPEEDDSVVVNANEAFISGFLYDTALGGTTIEGGVWEFNMYAYVSDATAISTLILDTFKVVSFAGTVAVTGTGTSRTATVTGSTPFVAGDANASAHLASFVQTPNGTFQITGYTSNVEVTIETDNAYTNETGVVFTLHRVLFSVESQEINQLTTPFLYAIPSAQVAFAINSTDKMALRVYGKTTHTSNVTVHITHNSTNHYSHFHAPIIARHNDLAGLQGGSASERYHMTLAQNGNLHSQNTDTGTNQNTFAVGNGVAGNKVIQANNADVNKPALRYNDSTDVWEFSNDGTTWQDFGTGSGSVSYSLSFNNASLVAGILTVNHALSVNYPIVSVYDNSNKIIIPDEVTSVTANQLTIDLTSFGTIAGTWNLLVLPSGATAGTAVDTTNNQSVGGIKTFTSFPVTPSSAPTTNYQTANKKYVDDFFPLSTANGGTGSTASANAANGVVVLNGSGQLPAVSGALLTNLPFSSYDSGWFAVTAGTSYPLTHGLGTTKVILTMWFSTDSGGAGAVQAMEYEGGARGTYARALTSTTIAIRTPTNGAFSGIYGDDNTYDTFVSGYLRVIMLAV